MAKYGVGDTVRDKVNGDRWRVDGIVHDSDVLALYKVTKIEPDGSQYLTFNRVTLSDQCYELDTAAAVERVIALWLANDCWIPGADYKRLAEALGVNPERLENDRTRRVHAALTGGHYEASEGPR